MEASRFWHLTLRFVVKSVHRDG